MAKASLTVWPERHSSIAYWFSVWFGVGLIRPAPGSWGSLAALLLTLGYVTILGHSYWILAALIALITLAGVWAINHIEQQCGVHDAPEIVIDEVAGQWVAVLPILIFNTEGSNTWSDWVAAFGLFRLFDILKPWPIGWLDTHVSGGWGVMLDDLVAGLFAAIILTGLLLGGLL